MTSAPPPPARASEPAARPAHAARPAATAVAEPPPAPVRERTGPPLTPTQEAEQRFLRSTQRQRFESRRDDDRGGSRDSRPFTPNRPPNRPDNRPERGNEAGPGRFEGDGGQRYAENRSRPAYPDANRGGRPGGNWRGGDSRGGDTRGGFRRGPDTRGGSPRPSDPRRDGAAPPRFPRRDDTRPRFGERRPDGPPRDRAGAGGERPRFPRRDDTRPRGGEGRPYPRRDDAAPRPFAGGAGAARREGAPGSDRPRFPRRDDARPGRAVGPGAPPRREEWRPRPDAGRSGPPRRDDRGAAPRPFTPRPPRRDDAPRTSSERPRFERGSGERPRFDRAPRPHDATPGRERSSGPRPERRPPPITSRDFEREDLSLPMEPREAALRILIAVEVKGAFSDKLLEQAHARGGEPRDQALLHELVKGTLRNRGRLDWVLDRIVHIGIAATQPNVRNVLRLGAYQILFLDRVPTHAAVDESVKLAHRVSHAGAAGLVNSVLRRLAEEKDQHVVPEGDDAASLAAWGSHPQWLVERWLARFGVAETRALMLANNQPSRLGLRLNPMRTTRDQLISRLADEGIESTPGKLVDTLVWADGKAVPRELGAFRDGWCTAQDESEALVAQLVDPKPHERVLDLCAAPGGKCSQLAELMGDEGEVWALERASERVATLTQTLERLGTSSVHVVEGDGLTYTFPMPFDRVLVDAPCSGLGVIGRRADARWRKGPETLVELPPIQLELLTAGARRVRPGGVLVYSVCSFEPEETTGVVERFLAENPGYQLESAGEWLPAEVVDTKGFMCVLPNVHGCDGAFAARFKRA